MVVNQVWNDSFNPFKGFSTGRTNNFVPMLDVESEERKKNYSELSRKEILEERALSVPMIFLDAFIASLKFPSRKYQNRKCQRHGLTEL